MGLIRMQRDHERFHRHSRDAVTSRLRLRGHDYAEASTYFVTICTAHQACLFGDVRDGDMVLNDAGLVIESWWHTLPTRFAGVLLDEMVVMPNHIHGILSLGTDPAMAAPSRTLSDVIGWFKTRTVNDYGLGVRVHGWQRYSGRLWQPGYFERIIRSDAALDRLRAYISGNPAPVG